MTQQIVLEKHGITEPRVMHKISEINSISLFQ